MLFESEKNAGKNPPSTISVLDVTPPISLDTVDGRGGSFLGLEQGGMIGLSLDTVDAGSRGTSLGLDQGGLALRGSFVLKIHVVHYGKVSKNYQ